MKQQEKWHNLYLNGFESQRLIFRKLRTSDVQHWIPFYKDNPHLAYLNFPINASEPTMASRWINTQLERYASMRFGHLALIEKQSNKFIGQSGLVYRKIADEEHLEVAFAILPELWGHGFASEASQKLIQFACKNGITKKLISIIHCEHISSQKVALKNDFIKGKSVIYEGRKVYVFEFLSSKKVSFF